MDDENKPNAKAKRKPLVRILTVTLSAAALAGAGGAGGFYAARAGLAGTGDAGDEGQDKPKRVPKEKHGDGEDASRYETLYFQIEQNFTSNLKDSARYVQVSLGVATNYDQQVIDNVKKHEVAIRSAVLGLLANQTEAEVTSAEGKARLQAKLRDAVNAVLEKKEGFGGITDVYFTGFIVQ